MAEQARSQNTRQFYLSQPLPPKEVCLAKLKQAHKYGLREVFDTITDAFLAEAVTKRTTYQGLILDWQRAEDEKLMEAEKQNPELMESMDKLLDGYFYEVIDTIVPHPKDAAIAKEYMRDFERSVKNRERE